MVQTALFNFNNVAVLFGGFLSVVLSFMLIFFHQENHIKRFYWFLFAAFFFLGTLHSIDIILYWSGDINAFLASISAIFFFLYCIYTCILVIHLLKNFKGFSDIKVEHRVDSTPVVTEPQQQLADKFEDFMKTHKPYLEPHITVERLAAKLQVSPKLLSTTMNGHLHKNFFEIIGFYRVEEAKKQLADPACRHLSIIEIMKSCGFSSKSVFNQAFKKSAGMTPSHYRNQHFG